MVRKTELTPLQEGQAARAFDEALKNAEKQNPQKKEVPKADPKVTSRHTPE